MREETFGRRPANFSSVHQPAYFVGARDSLPETPDAQVAPELHATSIVLEGTPAVDWDAAQAAIATHGEHSRPSTKLQQGLEILLAIFTILLTLPLMVILAIIIKLDSPGPALFRQLRIGKGGKPFWFTKFRTYYVDAKERFPELYAYKYTQEELESLKFKVPNDPRMTKLGRWLRKSTLDELPNFLHVVNGSMSLVGPRPEIPEMLPYYSHEGLKKFQVRPGITGYAQTAGRGWLTFHDTVQLDVDYVQERSALVDAKILFRTLYKIVIRDGAF